MQFSVLILFFPKDTHLGSSANFGVSIFLVNKDDEFVSLMSMRVGGLGGTFKEKRSRRKMMLGDEGFAERQRGEVHGLIFQWHQQWQLA